MEYKSKKTVHSLRLVLLLVCLVSIVPHITARPSTNLRHSKQLRLIDHLLRGNAGADSRTHHKQHNNHQQQRRSTDYEDFYDADYKRIQQCYEDEDTNELCQRCSKVTKSAIVFPMCCNNEDDTMTWLRKKAKASGKCLNPKLLEWNIHVESENNFPTAAGLASSAAGYACFVYTLATLYGIEDEELSGIARMGSGSACRSLHSGYVQWARGEKPDGSDSLAIQLASASAWPDMHVLILVVSDRKKATASTHGMATSVKTSDLLKYRASKCVPERVQLVQKAIAEKDFDTFGRIAMKDSNQFHAVCLDTFPPCFYLNDVSRSIIRMVDQINNLSSGEPIKVAYSFDAGPNACLFMLEKDVAEVSAIVRRVFPFNQCSTEEYYKGIPNDEQAMKAVPASTLESFVEEEPNLLRYIIHTKVGEGLKKLRYELKLRTLQFYLQPIPNVLFEQLQSDQLVNSEHTLFVSPTVFREYVVEHEINWINLVLKVDKSTEQTEKQGEKSLVSIILNKQDVSLLCQIAPHPKVPLNALWVKENLIENFNERYTRNGQRFWARLQRVTEGQHLPAIVAKASIFIYQTPYDLSSDMVDFILGRYFETPQLLYRNHTYQVPLTERFLGNTFYTKNFALLVHMKSLWFKCLNLDSAAGAFEMNGIAQKSLTTLQQTTTYNNFLLPERFDGSNMRSSCPFGLKKYHDSLRSSLQAYMRMENNGLVLNGIYPVFMLRGERGIGKMAILRSVASTLGIPVYYADCSEIMTSISSQTETKLSSAFNKAKICEPLIICLENFEVFGVDNEGHEDQRITGSFQAELATLFGRKYSHPVVVVAVANQKDSNTPKLTSLFLEVIQIHPPTTAERLEMLRWISHGHSHRLPSHQLQQIAEQSQGFTISDLELLYGNALELWRRSKDPCLQLTHFLQSLETMKTTFSDSLGAPKVPKVLWSEIGGLAKLKTEIQNSIGLPLRHKHLMGKNMRRSGILLYGPPGTGKTLIAKAVATECNLSFLSVQGPELLNMYVGQSEQNVREVFARARTASPCVLFLDELDSLAPNRGVSGDSGGVMDRVVSQMLSEMDGISKDPGQQIFILAATNRPDLIDPALLRPGRFDKLLYVGPSCTVEDKESVLRAVTGRFRLAENLTLGKIAQRLKQDMTGADMYSICSNAWLSAVRRTVKEAIAGDSIDEGLSADQVVVTEEDFQEAIKKFIPSISPTDMAYFNQLKGNFSV
uniref:Peroxisomal ATPase PEX6 n=1 Tax=Anopheles farauti TaxID=69004 RepID=A0A182QM46_9DIPT